MGDIALSIYVGASAIIVTFAGVYFGGMWLLGRRDRKARILASPPPPQPACTCADWPEGLVEIDPLEFAKRIDG